MYRTNCFRYVCPLYSKFACGYMDDVVDDDDECKIVEPTDIDFCFSFWDCSGEVLEFYLGYRLYQTSN